ncbi:hypothetical protein [Pseudomonas aeruginosa]|uniref:hypothetical protein n=1 Tax=Pseudomonas aeruginosa TaxID=287 RepID=UPI00155E0B9C|nr:hypothetical protein [Pseudomonas aeruginosa]NRC34139.1 hypothetical protein [Pseudomonas aeruginosa]
MRTMKLCASAFGVLFAVSAIQAANAASTFVLGMTNNSPSNETAVPAPVGAEGFVEVSAFYRDGPLFRLCRPVPGKRVSVKDQSCVEVVSVNGGFFSMKGRYDEYRPVGPGLNYQEYLDQEFGEGVTEFIGLSSRFTGYKSSLVLFYRLPTTAQGS